MIDRATTTRFAPGPYSLSKVFDDQVLLLHIRSKRMDLLNATGSRLWQFIVAGNTRGQIQEKMLQEFQVEDYQLSEDIDRILMTLIQEDFIRRSE